MSDDADTSSSSGMDVLQSPTRLSHPAVRRCVPLALGTIDDSAPECKCSVASVLGCWAESAVSMESGEGMEVMRAVVSYDELAMRRESSVVGIQHAELTGAVCPPIVWSISWVELNMRMLVSYEAVSIKLSRGEISEWHKECEMEMKWTYPFLANETDDTQSGCGIDEMSSGGRADGMYSISRVSSYDSKAVIH